MLSFREREWLALLPADLGVAAQIGPTPAPADPAAGLRDAEPLSPDTVSRAFSGLPVLRGFSKLSFALGPWAARSYAFRACSVSVAAALLLIPVWLFNDSAGTFGARQMAFGTAALGLSHAALILIHSTADGFRRLLSGSTLLPSSVGGSAFDSHPFASLVRYLQLIEISSAASGADQKEDVAAEHGIGSSATRSILVTHDRADPLCPCSLPECAGRLVLSTGWLYMGAVVLNIAFGIAACIFTGWTALVTFAPLFWSSGWAALGVFLLLATLVHTPVTFLVLPQSSVSLLRLSLRLQHRSLYLALRDFLARYHDALFSGFPVDWEQLPREDLFEVLVTRLSRVWERGHFWIQSGQASLALFGLQEVVPIVLNIVGRWILHNALFNLPAPPHLQRPALQPVPPRRRERADQACGGPPALCLVRGQGHARPCEARSRNRGGPRGYRRRGGRAGGPRPGARGSHARGREQQGDDAGVRGGRGVCAGGPGDARDGRVFALDAAEGSGCCWDGGRHLPNPVMAENVDYV
ncbi:hypothetical protein DFJ74DRAFT_728699 [Hyaloraphidium curvatum]|nr:hypothetical protein DFJ74DRAFT_728699 [Hyaloraphidium curvatum]